VKALEDESDLLAAPATQVMYTEPAYGPGAVSTAGQVWSEDQPGLG
jgi:hypothetical protein